MKVIHTFSIGAAMMGMTCLFGAVPAANSGQGDRMTDSTQIAQVGGGTSGTGSGMTGGMPSVGGDPGLPRGSSDFLKGAAGTYPEKAKPGTGMDPQMRTPESSSGMTRSSAGSAGSSTGPTGSSPSSGMSSGGSGSSSGSGGGGK